MEYSYVHTNTNNDLVYKPGLDSGFLWYLNSDHPLVSARAVSTLGLFNSNKNAIFIVRSFSSYHIQRPCSVRTRHSKKYP